MLEKKFILGVGITNATKQEGLEYIIKGLEKSGKKYFIVTPNSEILVFANKAKTYKKILNNAEIALPDGVGVIIAGKIFGIKFKGRITGVELLESLCSEVSEKPITVGFLGGGERIAEKTAECLIKKHPKLKVVFAAEEWEKEGFDFQKKNQESRIRNQESGAINKKEKIHNSLFMLHDSIDVLFVAFGAPKQELWISKNLDKLPVRVAIGVGGAFDYISGKIPRAPRWVQKLGFEWLFRLIIQPWRLKRQLALLEFIFLVLREKLASKRVI
jgi:N-acetylglucosaminyldiphosphoundecaprenol N-acetyl-beta-D-mannosaminyltransferase